MNLYDQSLWRYATPNHTLQLPARHRVAWLAGMLRTIRTGYSEDLVLSPIFDAALNFCWDWVAEKLPYGELGFETTLANIENLARTLPTHDISGQSILPIYHLVAETQSLVGVDAAATVNFLGHLYSQVASFRFDISYKLFDTQAHDRMDNIANTFSYRTFVAALQRQTAVPSEDWLADVAITWII